MTQKKSVRKKKSTKTRTGAAAKAEEQKPQAAPAGTTPQTHGAAPRVVLKPYEDRRIRRGHAWIFSNEVQTAANVAAGDTVHFYTAREEFLGVGFYNPHTLIAGRLLDRHLVELNTAFIENRLRRALETRLALSTDKAYRWVFGESDDLPGLVIDRYGDALVIQSYCAGMDKLLPPIVEAAQNIENWNAVVLRNDADLRRLEHLESKTEVVHGQVETPHWFEMDGLKLAADLLKGQKTGFFFDQRENRKIAARFAPGKRVADVFCHTGGFGLWCAQAGAKEVIGVDSSKPALELAKNIFSANKLTSQWVLSDGFEWLQSSKDKFDMIVLDPPKFAGNRKQIPSAIQGYIRLNSLAMKRVASGGYLATASCSQHIGRDEFRQILSRASQESGRRVRLLYWGGQAPDHPIRLTMPETEYLKFALLQVT